MNIGTTIKTIRKSQGMSQGKLASLVGIQQSTLSFIENNKARPHVKTLEAISEHTGVPVPLIYIWSVGLEDVPEENHKLYNELWPKVEELANFVFNGKN